METENILEKIKKLEEQFLPIKDILEKKDTYKKNYKGMISIQSKIIYNPDVLFIGINPGQGAYIEENNNNILGTQVFPKRLIIDVKDENKLILDWLKKGNARGESINKKWFAYDWTDRNKKINNVFPARMVDLLYLICEYKFGNNLTKDEQIKKIETEIVPKIMYTNIIPIATKSTKELEQIFSSLSKEKELKHLWNLDNNKKRVFKKDVNEFFRQKIFDLIDILNPKTIVCIGFNAQYKLTYIKIPRDKKNYTQQHTYTIRNKKYPLITFKRSGNWGGETLREVAKQINELLKTNLL